jgi:RNA polymerase sigma factor (TIGR02999 family)
MGDLTMVLQAVENGEKTPEDLLPLVYDELRRVAAARMARESEGQTLQPTALVHEAWLQLVGEGGRTWKNRTHFFGAAADAMRRILIDSARRKAALKRGGGQSRASLDELEFTFTMPAEEVLLIDEALERLEAEDPERARVVTLKFFGGFTNEEVAQDLGVSLRTVVRHWTLAKIKLFRWIQTQTKG